MGRKRLTHIGIRAHHLSPLLPSHDFPALPKERQGMKRMTIPRKGRTTNAWYLGYAEAVAAPLHYAADLGHLNTANVQLAVHFSLAITHIEICSRTHQSQI
jgi:hypothetical protein